MLINISLTNYGNSSVTISNYSAFSLVDKNDGKVVYESLSLSLKDDQTKLNTTVAANNESTGYIYFDTSGISNYKLQFKDNKTKTTCNMNLK